MAGAATIAQSRLAERVPPQAYFVVSAVFHYLGPAFAVMLFSAIAPLGVAWLRIASAAIVVAILTDVRLMAAPWGYLFAFANCALFVLYIVLGHRISGRGGIDRLGLAMLIAMVAALPIGIADAAPAFLDPACSPPASAWASP